MKMFDPTSHESLALWVSKNFIGAALISSTVISVTKPLWIPILEDLKNKGLAAFHEGIAEMESIKNPNFQNGSELDDI